MNQVRLRATPPIVPPGLVHRRGLEVRLGDPTGRAVVMVSAGPGSGKTLTVAAWLAEFAGAQAWLTVDETDNDLRTFWSDLLAALAIGAAVPEDSPLRELMPASSFGAAEVLQVRAGLAGLPGPVVLVLDDVHHLHNPEVLDSLSALIEQRPMPMRLVMLTRADPALRLHRVRVSGGLMEIRSRDLAFTKEETTELFAHDGIELTDDQLRLVLDRTQGWPVGVRLAAMFLSAAGVTRGIEQFTGTERSVAEYLVGEVLDRQPAHIREFLLRTSVVERLNPSLATALSGRDDSSRVLEDLVAANAFVVGLGDDSGWFRYHPLLRELLEHRLILERPGTADPLRLTAAAWFVEHGQPIQAIGQVTAAGDWDEAGRLLTASALPLILTPEGPALAAALEPAARRAVDEPRLSTLLAAAIWHFQRHDFAAMYRDATEATEFLPDAPDAIRIPAEILIEAATFSQHRVVGSAALVASSTRLLSLLDAAPRRLLPAARQYRVIGLNNLGVGRTWAGDLAGAEADLLEAEAQAVELGLGLTVVSARSYLSVLDALHGRLRQAHRRAASVRAAVDRRGWAGEPQALGAYVALGLTLLARNQLDAASDVIDAGLTASTHGADAGCRLLLGVSAIGVAAARGDLGTMRSAADRLATELASVPDPPDLLARLCAVAQSQVQLMSGHPDQAATTVVLGQGSGYADAAERIALGRTHLALGRTELLPELLRPVIESGASFLGIAVEARILLALAADREHRDTAAITQLTEAIDLAEPEGMIRPFLNAGPPLRSLIVRHRHIVARHLDFTQELLIPQVLLDAEETGLSGEHLTERELIVLRYLPTMLKAGEIAADLFVSINTVKAHLRSIYRKLDVTSRRAAVERARELNLL
jgi:LuxR family maltose regulon positive regulatory protein